MIFINITPVSAENNDKTLENGYYPENSEVYQNASPAMKSMYDLQNEITDTLKKVDGKYVFSEEAIREIIYRYDFSAINEEIGQNYTHESFLNLVIESISATSLVQIKTRAYTQGPMCSVNKTDSIWNSSREYRDRNRTATHIQRLRVDADSINAAWTGTKALNVALLATFYSIYPGLKLAVIAGGIIKSVPVNWMKGVANSLSSNNYNGCGTVLDINLVGWYSSWNQANN